MTLHKTIERVLIGLGERHEVEVDSDEVRARALPLIKSGLERSPLLPRAVFNEGFDDLDFRTDITDGTIKRVDRARRFVGDLGEILLIDATWRLEFRLLYQERPASDETLWYVLDELDATGRVQVYLGQSESEATTGQFIAAQLKPRQTVWRTETGHMIGTTEDP